jgi:hypothetical protein
MRTCRLGAFTLFVSCGLSGSGALAADKAATQSQAIAAPQAPAQTSAVKAHRRVPAVPADLKARGEQLRNAASPAVKAWLGQNADAIANGTGDPESLARVAVHARWPNLRIAGAADALAFLAVYEAEEILRVWIGRTDSVAELSTMNQMRMQQVMDRRTKLIAILSNLLKKMSDTSAGILQNLK